MQNIAFEVKYFLTGNKDFVSCCYCWFTHIAQSVSLKWFLANFSEIPHNFNFVQIHI